MGYRLATADWRGVLCTRCFKRSSDRGEVFEIVETLIGKGDGFDVDVCEDCGKTVRRPYLSE